MNFLSIIFLIFLTFPSSRTKNLYEHTKDTVLSKSEFDGANLLAQFLIDHAPESVKPALEEKFKHAFTAKWNSNDEFDKYVTAFLADLENQVVDGKGKIVESRSRREIKYGNQEFYEAIYALYVFINADEENRPLLKEQLIEAQKMDWDDLEEFKNYCDDVAKKIEKQNNNNIDYKNYLLLL